MNVLGIGLDYLMLQKDKIRGDVRKRQLDYAEHLQSLTLIVYSPKELGLKPEQWTDNLWAYPTNSKNKATFIFDALRIASRICGGRKIDTITTEDPFTTGFVGYLLKRKFGIPLNVQAHIDFFDNQYWMRLRKINRFFNGLGKFTCRHADTIRVVARETKEKLEASGISPERISLISVHSELNHFNNLDGAGTRKHFLSKGFEQILLFVGRLVKQKDIPNLFNAFEIIVKEKPKALLLLVGKGPKRDILEKLAHDKGIASNLIFTGAVEHSVIQEYYAASDIFVLPSIFEGRATVIVEAILSKKPIVTTDVSGLREWMIDEETGFIVKRKDPQAFAEKVLCLLDNPEIAKSFGEKGYQLAQSKLKEIGDIGSMIRLWEKTASLRR
ncbi:MAG: glycosyltransferase family 4 protein [Deltaproteobacteria bacterium]|nr:glycosyltransferase family 4 protein [Deltaproteobacteria bacterium]